MIFLPTLSLLQTGLLRLCLVVAIAVAAQSPSIAAETKPKLIKPNKVFVADTATPISYKRTNIAIIRGKAEKMPWQASAEKLVLNTEIRDGMSLYNQNGWFNLSSYAENSGVMLAFSTADQYPISHMEQYAPTDILFIDKQGKITQIAPNILLSELEQDIVPAAPVLAFLFMKGGACKELSINAGDEIEYELFKKPPAIINAPTEASEK